MATNTYNARTLLVPAKPRNKRLREIGDHGGSSATVDVDLTPYLLKATFDDLFEKVNLGTEEAPKWSIKAKYGLWTEQFLSAKGVGSDTSTGGGGGIDYEALEEYLRDNLAGYLSQYAKISDIPDVSGFLTDYSVKSLKLNDEAAIALKGDGTANIKAATSIDGSGHITAGNLQADGSIGVGVESGYGIPSNSKQQGWDAAKALLEELFEKVNLGTDSNPQWTIKAKMSLWTEGFLSAKGVGDGSAEGGIGYEAVQEMIADALAGYNPSTGEVDWDSIVGKPDVFSPASHSHTWDSITGKPSTFTPASHTHAWGSITGKPATFAPSAHSHTKSEITDFAHSHAIADVTGLQTALDGKVPNTRTITAGTGLTGGGNLTADRTIKLTDKNVALLAMLDSMFEKVAVNGVDTIKAKMSLWTEGYLSAKGTSSDSSASGLTAEAVQEMIDDALVGYTPGDGVVEWTDIVGKPDTFAPSSHTHSYLPLSGGTLTGSLTMNSNVVIGNSGVFMLGHKPTVATTGVSATQWFVGASDSQGVIRSNDTDLVHYRNGNATPAMVILDSGNYSSYALPRLGTIVTDFNAETAIGIRGYIGANATNGPTDASNNAINLQWGDLITFRGSADTGMQMAYGFNNGTAGSNIFYRFGRQLESTQKEWYSWKKLLDSANYSAYALPLSGGTLTGNLTIGSNAIIGGDGQYMLGYKPASGFTGVSNTQWGVGSIQAQGVIRSNDTDLIHYRNGNATAARVILDSANYSSYALPLTGGTLTGSLSVSGNLLPGTTHAQQLGSSSKVWEKAYLRYIDTDSGYNLRICCQGTETISIDATTLNVGIGTTTPAYKLDVAGDTRVGGKIIIHGTNTSNDTRFITSNNASNIYFSVGGVESLVARNDCVRRGTSATSVSLGTSDYPWNGVYAKANATTANNDTGFVIPSAGRIGGLLGGGLGAYAIDSLYLRFGCGSDYSNMSNGLVLSTSGSTLSSMLTVSNKININSPAGTDGMIYCQLNGGTQIGFGVGTSTKRGVYDRGLGWVMYTNGTNVLFENGNVGIGTTEPQAMFHAHLSASASGNAVSIISNHSSSPYGLITRIYGTGCVSLQSQRITTTSEYFSLSLNPLGGNVGIGTTSPDAKLHVAGAVHATTGVYSEGYVSALQSASSSDIRLKDIIGDYGLSVEQIANAPSVRFAWKDSGREDIGSIAQYWQEVSPHSVLTDPHGNLSLQYGKLGLLASISVAREVIDNQHRIAMLEAEVERLKKQLTA